MALWTKWPESPTPPLSRSPSRGIWHDAKDDNVMLTQVFENFIKNGILVNVERKGVIEAAAAAKAGDVEKTFKEVMDSKICPLRCRHLKAILFMGGQVVERLRKAYTNEKGLVVLVDGVAQSPEIDADVRTMERMAAAMSVHQSVPSAFITKGG